MGHHPTNSEIYALLRKDFRSFVTKVFATTHPGEELLENWLIDAMIWTIEQVMAGETRRIMINVPPRLLKSLVFSVAWPAFLLGHYPTLTIFVVSHSLDLAAEHHASFRKVVESDWYKAAFPTMAPAADKETELIYRTSQGGQRKAFSVESKITGQGAHFIILDDVQDASDAMNEQALEKVNIWLTTVLLGRVKKASETVIAVAMQRLALNDASARLLEIDAWTHLSLPAIADRDIEVPIGSGKTHLFRKGELLHPELLTSEFLAARKRAMGLPAYSAQYLQTPLPAGGGCIDVAQFQRYNALPKAWDTRFLSIDAASGSDSGSYSVIQCWQITDGNIYLLGSSRGRWAFPELRKRALLLKKHFSADFFLIENASSGRALAQELQGLIPPEQRSHVVQTYTPKD